MSSMQRRFILIGLLWAVVCGLFLYNLQSAASYRKYRQEVATIAALRSFLSREQAEIAAAPREVATFYQPVESIDLGLLFLEEDLGAAAHASGLDGFEFIAAKGPGSDGAGRLLTIKFVGELRNAITLVESIEGRRPYLLVQGVNASADAAGELTYSLSLNYFHKIKGS